MSWVYTSTLVARKFLDYANDVESASLMTPLKLMKLVYIAHGCHLAIYDDTLVDEYVYAWENGPVFPDLYFAIERFGRNPVKEVPYTDREVILMEEGKLRLFGMIDVRELNLIETLSEEYRENTGGQLSALTHKIGTPWHETCEKHGGHDTGPIIPNSLIKKYYSKFLVG